jgi:predicted lipoprotein with Yx(FWY)xxD motif
MRSSIVKVATAAVVAALALAACSSDDDSGSSAATTPPTEATTTTAGDTPTTGAGGTVVVKVGETSLGDAAVTADGMTLYLFENDTATKSACGAGCDTVWPPLTVTGTPKGDSGVIGALGTITRDDGTKQLTIAGHPVYTYSGDKSPGDANGQEIGDVWYVIAPNGQTIEGEGEGAS